MKGKSSWNKGLTIEDYDTILGKEKTSVYRNKLHNVLSGQNPWKRMSAVAQEKAKIKLELLINTRYAQGWMPKAGRCKKIRYESSVCGKISLDGFWELLVAIYFDTLQVKWVRNTKKFEYINPKGERSTYTPDFYVIKWNTYIEVKGYEDELSKCKQRQFASAIETWGKEKIIEIEKILSLKVVDLRNKYRNRDKMICCGEVLERP